MDEQTTSEKTEEAAVVLGRVAERKRLGRPLPKKGEVKRYILTSAQNNTHVHEDVWINLLALASYYDAELLVGTYSYQKARHGKKAVKRGTTSARDREDLWYDPQILEHICDEPVQLAPSLIWCGEKNILPTSMNPLAQLEAYNGRCSNVVPHAKFAVESIASLGDEATKFNYTTGTVTQRNYLQKKIGLLSERYHGYGGVLVEVCSDGSWYVRQLEASEAAGWAIRDLTLKVQDGVVTTRNPVEAIVWGDIHTDVIDEEADRIAWDFGGMLDELRPRYQMAHDLHDHRRRNHHEIKNPISRLRHWQSGKESVDDEIALSVRHLYRMHRVFCTTVIVPSNHHEALEKWLKDTDGRQDPVNLEFWLDGWKAIVAGEEDLFEWAMRQYELPENVKFLRTDQSFVVCKQVDGQGIELGMHGHLGINGARGNTKNFAKLGRKSSGGHSHTACWYLDVVTAGTMSRMRIGYNRGPSSWSHSQVVVYPEGTRQLVTFWNGRWRA